MAIFGAPVAHGDDAERAVRAGLGMQAAMSEVNEPLAAQHGVSFQLCVGINTGEVLAGHVGDSYTVIGDTVNVAARLQAAARPGSVTVGEATYRATREAIDFSALRRRWCSRARPSRCLPGRRWPPTASPRRAPRSPARRELRSWAAPQSSPQLHDLLARVKRRRGPHLATVIGDPGVGKSRLLRQFELELQGQNPPPLVRHGRCLPYGSSIVYWPLGEVIRSECAIIDSDPPATAWAKLLARMGELLDGPDVRQPRRRPRKRR